MSHPKLPSFFRPILWSYDFDEVDPLRDRKTIIINVINYGDLKHWQWIADFYGKSEVAEVLKNAPITEIRNRVVNLASLLFKIDNWNYASRGVNK